MSHFLNSPTTNQENITGPLLLSLSLFSGTNLVFLEPVSIKMIVNNINQMDEQSRPERFIFFLRGLSGISLLKFFTIMHT